MSCIAKCWFEEVMCVESALRRKILHGTTSLTRRILSILRTDRDYVTSACDQDKKIHANATLDFHDQNPIGAAMLMAEYDKAQALAYYQRRRRPL